MPKARAAKKDMKLAAKMLRTDIRRSMKEVRKRL